MPTLTTNGTGRHSASYDSLGTLQMLEVSRGELPREYSSWDEINPKIPFEWRDGKALPIPEDSMLRTPSAIEGEGGAITELQSRERGRMLQVRDQMAQLAAENGLKVSDGIANSLLPTPAVGHIRNHDEPIKDYLARRKKMDDGEYKGMPGVSLGVAVRMEILPTPRAQEPGSTSVGYGDGLNDVANRLINGHAPKDLLPTVKARDSNPEGYEAGLRRGMPQLGTMMKAIVDGDERLDLFPTPTTMDYKATNDPDVAQKFLDEGRQTCLTYEIQLLPTPIVRDYKDGSAAQERDGKISTDTVARAIFNSGEVLLGTQRTSSANSPSSKQVENGADKARLEDQVRSANEGFISWGKFEPAIRRWEQVLGRPAPAPTKPDGKDGNHRLAAEFTEWMMGLDFGHVTDPELGLSRVEMLKLCGNGVVPQQAELAIRILLKGIEL
jgi:hypothetical protein